MTSPIHHKNVEHRFSVKDITTIALLSGLAGTLSTFVGYLALQLNFIFGVEQGAGQILSGAHIMWLLLIAVLIPQPGSVIFGGFLKGLVEFFTGSSKGVMIILFSLTQGIAIEAVMWVMTKFKKKRHSVFSLATAGAISNLSYIMISQIVFFPGDYGDFSLYLLIILVMMIAAVISGIIFGGYLTYDIISIIKEADIWMFPDDQYDGASKAKENLNIFRKPYRILTVAIVIILILAGSGFALISIHNQLVFAEETSEFESPYICTVSGSVNNPYTFVYRDFSSQEVTIEAKLDGAVTHLPPDNYTGVPLRVIIDHAWPKNNSEKVIVRAQDNYEKTFNFTDVMNDSSLILKRHKQDEYNKWLWLIAGDYAGGYWVKMVSEVIIQ